MNEMKTMERMPDIANDIIRIHKVITRGLTIAGETTRSMIQHNPSDTQSLNGFLDYLRSLTSVLHAHHSTETEIAFPLFQKKSLDAPYDLLIKGHVKMEAILNEINSTIATLADHNRDMVAMKKIQNLVQALVDIWDLHIQVEECRFAENTIGTHISIEEQQLLSMGVGQHMLKNSGPDYLVIPFVLYNLSGNDRAIMQRLLPPDIISLQATWKDRWAPMKPFLLE